MKIVKQNKNTNKSSGSKTPAGAMSIFERNSMNRKKDKGNKEITVGALDKNEIIRRNQTMPRLRNKHVDTSESSRSRQGNRKVTFSK